MLVAFGYGMMARFSLRVFLKRFLSGHQGDGRISRCFTGGVFTSVSLNFFFLLFFFFHLTYSRWTSSLPSCLWSQRIFPSLPGSRLTIFLSRSKFSTLTTRQPMVDFYLLTFPRFPLRKKEHKSYFGKNRTHDFRTSRCAAYLLDHSGDTLILHDVLFFLMWSAPSPDVAHFFCSAL